MGENMKNKSTAGMGFFSVLQLIFIVLKLLNVITWSWWIVLIPTWIELFLLLAIVVALLWLDRRNKRYGI